MSEVDVELDVAMTVMILQRCFRYTRTNIWLCRDFSCLVGSNTGFAKLKCENCCDCKKIAGDRSAHMVWLDTANIVSSVCAQVVLHKR